ncbi:MAG: hypothetical protein IKP43_06605, partial [Bacteroidaceae bacterium]|nr:hypothetical protein [Bacteroidaceae bacterium]
MTILLLAMVVNAWANPTFFPEADGWQRVTSITQSDIGDRYFVFVADGQDLMLHSALATNSEQKKTDATTVLYYTTIVQPFRDLSTVFTIEPNGSLYAMRNLEFNTYQLQGSSNVAYWRTNDVTSTSTTN